jgi:hypothetical protein
MLPDGSRPRNPRWPPCSIVRSWTHSGRDSDRNDSGSINGSSRAVRMSVGLLKDKTSFRLPSD